MGGCLSATPLCAIKIGNYMKEEIELNAIRDSDIDSFLSKYDLLEKYISGQIHCVCCDEVITKNNLGGFFIKDGQVLMFCNLTECLDSAVNNHGC